MPTPTGLALASALLLVGSAAHAAPPPGLGAKSAADAKPVAFAAGAAVHDPGDDPNAHHDAARTVAPGAAARGWQVEIGPYAWASSVDASVSFGSRSGGVDLDLVTLVRHTRSGIEALAELRRGRFALSGDFMYGATAITGTTSIASVPMTLTGTANGLLADAAASYQVVGDADAPFALEARTGVRYQRMTVTGNLGLTSLAPHAPEVVDQGGDAVVGARAVVRPHRALLLSALLDAGVLGASDRTWSASVDATLRVSSHVLLIAGWRTLTTERAHVSLALRGPRAAVQLVF